MRIRILDRILVALAGLILVAVCAGLVAQAFFSVDVIGYIKELLTAETSTRKIILGVVAGALLIIGLYCLLMLSGTGGGRISLSCRNLKAAILRFP